MKKIIWIGTPEIIPGYGSARTNEEIELPAELADSFVSQGKAKLPRSKSTTKEEG